MSINQKPWLNENLETDISIDKIQESINTNLATLSEIDPGNKNLSTLNKATEFFKDNSEALKIIDSGLQQISNQVDKIWADWISRIRWITWKLASFIEESENKDDSADDLLNDIV